VFKIKYIIPGLFVFIHLLGLAGFKYYYSQTAFTGQLVLWSFKPHVVVGITPSHNRIVQIQQAGDTLKTHSRTLKSILVYDQNGISHNLNLSDSGIQLLHLTDEDINYRLMQISESKFRSILFFLLNNTPFLKTYLLLWLSIIVVFILFRYRSLKNIKFKFFRVLLKPGNSLRQKTCAGFKVSKLQRAILIITFLLIIPASYLRLGKYPFSQSSEEKRRALVSLEMKIQHNCWFPTTCGEAYYNKPPLFNWILIPFIDNKNVEFFTRAVSVSILLFSGLLVFLLLRKSQGKDHGLFVAFLFLTSFHALFDLSLVLNLDVLFTLLIICLFYLNYKFAEQKKYWLLFSVGYILTSLAFLTKGFPALWFQAVSLFISLALQRKLIKLFTLQHITGLLVLVILPGIFFIKYSQYGNVQNYILQLMKETLIAGNFNLFEILKHFISFPAINMLAFAPGFMLIPFLFLRNSVITIIKSRRLSYLVLVIITGSSVFSISPYYQPYYCLMFVPLVIDIIVSLLPSMENFSLKEKFSASGWLLLFVFLYQISYYSLIWYYIIIITIIVFVLIFTNRLRIWILLIICLLMVLFKLTYPVHELKHKDFTLTTKAKCMSVVKKHQGNNEICIDPRDTKINYVSVFYLTYFNGKIIKYNDSHSYKKYSLYLTSNKKIPEHAQIIDTIPQQHWEYISDYKLKGVNKFTPLLVYSLKEKTSSSPN